MSSSAVHPSVRVQDGFTRLKYPSSPATQRLSSDISKKSSVSETSSRECAITCPPSFVGIVARAIQRIRGEDGSTLGMSPGVKQEMLVVTRKFDPSV